LNFKIFQNREEKIDLSTPFFYNNWFEYLMWKKWEKKKKKVGQMMKSA
jgi:hypothetical protein